MAYTKTNWLSRLGTNLNKFTKSQETSTSVVLTNAPDAVSQAGTPFSAENMNKMEQGIYDAHQGISGLSDTLTSLTDILAASGGRQVIKRNVNGDPSIFVRIPRFNLEDIHASLGTGPHPAFIVNGVVKNEIFIGAYQAIIKNNCALSLPGQSPRVSINFDSAKTVCVANGPGFHLMTNWEWAAVALWCIKNGFQPRGNTLSSKSLEAPWETGTLTPDNALKTLGGSGPASWRHDNTPFGIADLVGNVWEWNDGLKIVDGQIYMPNDNDFTHPEADWSVHGVYLDASAGPGDGNGSAQNGTPILSNGISRNSETPTPMGGGDNRDLDYTSIRWQQIALSAGYNGLTATVRQRMAQALIAPKLTSEDSAVVAAASGTIWVRNYRERLPSRGGNWGYGAWAGLAALDLRNRRVYSSVGVGFRPAFIA